MEKSQQLQLQPPLPPPQQSLKCPRCDSANTKFCYYNNYSLSQPRHFCKACKRYWTRGGTLRNVPVGGGCRKNKRVKRADSSCSSGGLEGGSNPNPNYSSGSQIDISISGSSTPNHQINPLFYGLGSSEMNMGFPGRFSSGGYDLNPQLNALALGFSSGKQIQDSSSILSNYSIFGSSLMNQSKLISNGGGGGAFEELHLNGNRTSSVKEVKVELQEQQQSRFDWNNNSSNNNNGNLASSCQNQIEQIGFSSLDPSSLYWNPNSTTTSVGSLWHNDPNNLASSLTSLI